MLVVPEAAWLLWEAPAAAPGSGGGGAGAGLWSGADSPGGLTELDRARQLDRPLIVRAATGQIIPQLLIGTGAPAREVAQFLAMALALVALVVLLVPAVRRARGARAPAGPWLAGGLALSGFLIHARAGRRRQRLS